MDGEININGKPDIVVESNFVKVDGGATDKWLACLPWKLVFA